jgi:hypothetical protein
MKKFVIIPATIICTLFLSTVSTGQPIPNYEHVSWDTYQRQAGHSNFGINAMSACPPKKDEEVITCPPGPTGRKWFAYVYIAGVRDDIISTSVGQKAMLSPKSFQGKTVELLKTLRIGLDCVNPTTLRMLNNNWVEVSEIKKGKRDHELVLRLTPTKKP